MRATIACSILLVLTTFLLVVPAGRSLDHWLVDGASSLARRNPPLEASMRLATAAGTKAPVLTALLLPAAFGTEVARATVRVAIVSVAVNQAVTYGLKWVTRRTRPDGDDSPPDTSFPSGHASAAVGLAWVVSHRHRRLSPWLWVLAVWISASRVFLDRHYPSDVLAGALVGILFALLALHFEDRLTGKRRFPGR